MAKLMVALRRFLFLCALLLALPAMAVAFPVAQPGTEGFEVIVNGTGPVIATYQGYSTVYNNDLYLMLDASGNPGDDGNPANDKFLFNNRANKEGDWVNLGSFPVGTKLLFRLHVNDTGKDYFIGAGSRNPDGKPHARVQADWKPNETLVSFEDLFNGDFDYNDLSFSFVPTTVSGRPPGWYRNSGPVIIYEDSKLKVVWENSYIYQYPGKDPLYWYAQVIHFNKSNERLIFTCSELNKPSIVEEHMRGTEGIPPNGDGYVAAEETFCSRITENYTRIIEPGGVHYDWAIFHNVPGAGQGEKGEVSLKWGFFGTSAAWVNPWQTPIYAPPPVECPLELITLGTCQSQKPEGKAPNLIVLVHGCCTDAQDVYEWRALADAMVGDIMKSQPPGAWEIVVWDWHDYTPKPGTLIDQLLFKSYADKAYDAASDKNGPGQGSKLKDDIVAAINKSSVNAYEYIHFIGHSAGAKLIQEAAQKLAADKNNLKKKPFIHLTFLDAYTQNDNDSGHDQYRQGYGYLEGYSDHFAEHYVDIGLWYTDACLASAFNFDITHWRPISPPDSPQGPDEKEGFGHQWPRYWYEKSVTFPPVGPTSPAFAYGYSLSLEGGNSNYKGLTGRYDIHQQQQCPLLGEGTNCDTLKPADKQCW